MLLLIILFVSYRIVIGKSENELRKEADKLPPFTKQQSIHYLNDLHQRNG